MSEEQSAALSKIEHGGWHLLELISNILDIVNMESGNLKLQVAPVLVEKLCQSSLDAVKQQASAQGVSLEILFSEKLQIVIVDERRIRRVLINLLHNAVKFTPAGGKVTLRARIETVTSHIKTQESHNHAMPVSDNCLIIEIEDTGIGIASEDIDKLFQPFSQIDSGLNRQYEGIGSGLALVQKLVQIHGGDISVKSEVGQGSCFTIRLPCHSQDEAATVTKTLSQHQSR